MPPVVVLPLAAVVEYGRKEVKIMSADVKLIIANGPCAAVGGLQSLSVSGFLKDDQIIELNCPLRSKEAYCIHVDVDRLPCLLIPQYHLAEEAIYSEE